MKVKIITILFCMLAYHANLAPLYAQSSLAASLAGTWQFVAANNGVEVAPGVYSAGTDIVDFTATLSADGSYLQCHADNFYSKTGTAYAADWRILVENDGAGKHRLGWVLDSQQPVWVGNNRNLYLLSENSDVTALIGMTLWSPWSSMNNTSYTLSNTENNAHKVYGVLSDSQPFGSNLGWIEIWSSPRFEKLP
jgi:hypothetical protein